LLNLTNVATIVHTVATIVPTSVATIVPTVATIVHTVATIFHTVAHKILARLRYICNIMSAGTPPPSSGGSKSKLISATSKALLEAGGFNIDDNDEEGESNSEEVEYLRGVLMEKGDGVIMKAWRKYFDPYCIGDVTFTKFCKGLTSLGAAGDDAVDLWKKLDSDGTNLLTLDEVDMDSFNMMEYCQKFCDKFGGAAAMFGQVDYNRDGRLDRYEFGYAMQQQGFCDDPECPEFLNTPPKVSERLFPVCDVNSDGSISMLELLFLERDVEKRKQVRDKLIAEMHEKKFGKPKSMLAHFLLRDVTRATSTMDDYISFMNNYGGGGDKSGFKASDLQLLVANKKPAWFSKLQTQVRGDLHDPEWATKVSSQLDDYWKMEAKIALAKKEAKLFARVKEKKKGPKSPMPPKGTLDKEKIEARRYLKMLYQKAITHALVACEPKRRATFAPSHPAGVGGGTDAEDDESKAATIQSAYAPATKEQEKMLKMKGSGKTDKRTAVQKPTDIMRSTDQLYSHYAKH